MAALHDENDMTNSARGRCGGSIFVDRPLIGPDVNGPVAPKCLLEACSLGSHVVG